MADSKQPPTTISTPTITTTATSSVVPKISINQISTSHQRPDEIPTTISHNYHHQPVKVAQQPTDQIVILTVNQPVDHLSKSSSSHHQSCHVTTKQGNNRSLNGLVDIVNSIKTDSSKPTALTLLSSHTSKHVTSSIKPASTAAEFIECATCGGKSACMCNISRLALSRLYRSFVGFNHVSGNGWLNETGLGYHVIRRAVCHPSKQWAELHKDHYCFFDPTETEKIFYVL